MDKMYNGYIDEKDDIEVDRETGEIIDGDQNSEPVDQGGGDPDFIIAGVDEGEESDGCTGRELEIRIIYPTCRFCGKRQLPLSEYRSQAEADEAATRKCDCEEALKYQQFIERQEWLDENIKKLENELEKINEKLKAKNAALSDNLLRSLMETGILVLDGVIDVAAFKLPRIKINFSMNAKGNIVISVVYSEASKVEV